MKFCIKHFSILIFTIATTFYSCSSTKYFSEWYVPNTNEKTTWQPSKVCFNAENYQVNNRNAAHFPVKYIKLAFHFIKHPEQPYFSPYEAAMYANDLVRFCNDQLANNQPMNLPLGNTTAVHPILYRYIIDVDSSGKKEKVFLHTDAELAYMDKKNNQRNLFWKAQYEKYGIKDDNAIDVFMLEHPKDSLLSPTYKASMDGVGMGDWMKIVGAFQYSVDSFIDENGIKKRKWAQQYVGLFNHEMGHILGLPHTWKYNDGCDDTPQHENCWSYTDTAPCDKEVSNNMMDYNTYQNSLTPCQLGKINFNLTDKHNSIRKYLQNNWCSTEKFKDIVIGKNAKVIWQCNKQAEGNIILKENSTLTVSCLLSMPENSSIKIYPGAKLILDGGKIYNECNLLWNGIELLSSEKNSGQVELLNKAMVENKK